MHIQKTTREAITNRKIHIKKSEAPAAKAYAVQPLTQNPSHNGRTTHVALKQN